MTEYGDRLDGAADEAGRRGAELLAEAAGVTDVTPAQLQQGLLRGLREVRIPLQETVDAIDPPEAIAELHDLMWNWHAGFISIEQALADRVGETPDTAAGWTALSDSSEMAAYRAAVAEGKRICNQFQSWLDATEIAEAFEGTPWTPGGMREVVEAALGCEFFPDDPAAIYRYPPSG